MPVRSYVKGRNLKDRDLMRTRVVFFVLILTGFILIGRLADIQLFRGAEYSAIASTQRLSSVELIPKRGDILVSDDAFSERLRVIATNNRLNLVYVVPKEIGDTELVANSLADSLGLELDDVMSHVDKYGDPYEPIEHFVDDDTVSKILKMRLPGVYSFPEETRWYPYGRYFAHITGFLGYGGVDERVGQYGIEGKWEDTLRGEGGIQEIERDTAGRIIALGDLNFEEAIDGADIVLTIDYTIQTNICDILSKSVEKYAADRGSAIVMDPYKGRILALCNYPTFDPNKYSDVNSINTYINHAISTAYEPGSIFKPITMAAALDLGVLKPSDTYIDEGSETIGNDTIRNANQEKYGKQSMTEVLEKSINTGAIFALRQVGAEEFKKYVKNFGFGSLTGIELPAESAGNISSLDKRGEIYSATASFGQGITITSIQMVSAFSAIANGGILMRPYIISEVRRSSGEVEVYKPKEVRRVISSGTATMLSAMLVSVVKNGHGKYAQVPGFYVAGKTGTAQIAKTNGRGYSQSTDQSFVGFAPVERPRFVIMVHLNKPKKGRFSSVTAAPTFARMAKFLLQYYRVPPDF